MQDSDFYLPQGEDPDDEFPDVTSAQWERAMSRLAAKFYPDSGNATSDAAITAKHASIWHDAIEIIDATELPMCDMIQRELLGIAAGRRVKLGVAMSATTGLLREIGKLRSEAFKKAFELLRDREVQDTLGGYSMAQWGARILKADLLRIDNAIRSGLTRGLTNSEIARKVVGNASRNGGDGETELTRRQIAHLGEMAVRNRGT